MSAARATAATASTCSWRLARSRTGTLARCCCSRSCATRQSSARRTALASSPTCGSTITAGAFPAGASGLNSGHAGDIVAGLPGAMYWTILGQEQIRKLTEVGNEVGLGIYINNYAKLPGLPAEIEADAGDESRANVFGAATIGELAVKIGVDPAVLKAEVDEYNEYCHAGVDRKFHKLARYLIPVEEGPFSADKMENG